MLICQLQLAGSQALNKQPLYERARMQLRAEFENHLHLAGAVRN